MTCQSVKIWFFALLLLSGTTAAVERDNSAPWMVVTENFPPYSMKHQDQLVGYSVELTRAMFEQAGIPFNDHLMPWARAFKFAAERPNTLIYSMMRTDARESRFIWIGPVHQFRVYAWHMKDNPQVDPDDPKTRHVVLRASPAEKRLSATKQRVISVNSIEQAVGMVLAGRGDIVYVADNMWAFLQEALSLDELSGLQRDALLFDEGLFLGINRQSSQEQVEQLKRAYQQIATPGFLAKLEKRYFTSLESMLSQL